MTGLYKQTHTRTTLQCSEIIHVHTDKAPTWWQWNLCPTIWASEGTPRNWRRTVISLEMVTEVEGETENEREETEGVIRLWFPNLRYQRGTIKSGHRTHFCSRTQSRTITPNPACARWTTYYISSAAHAPISILSFILLRQWAIFQCRVSVSHWVSDRCRRGTHQVFWGCHCQLLL